MSVFVILLFLSILLIILCLCMVIRKDNPDWIIGIVVGFVSLIFCGLQSEKYTKISSNDILNPNVYRGENVLFLELPDGHTMTTSEIKYLDKKISVKKIVKKNGWGDMKTEYVLE